jgi:hypothetical protein
LTLLTASDDNGVEVYSGEMTLNGICTPGLIGYAGVWIDKDPRSVGYGVGCGYAFEDDDCRGRYSPIELDISGQSDLSSLYNPSDNLLVTGHTKVPFADSKAGKSFQFNNVSFVSTPDDPDPDDRLPVQMVATSFVKQPA